jgi:hypothetical protein
MKFVYMKEPALKDLFFWLGSVGYLHEEWRDVQQKLQLPRHHLTHHMELEMAASILTLRDTFLFRINRMISPTGKSLKMEWRGIVINNCPTGESYPSPENFKVNTQFGGLSLGRLITLIDYLGEFGKLSWRWARQQLTSDRLQHTVNYPTDQQTTLIEVAEDRRTEVDSQVEKIKELLSDIYPDINMVMQPNLTLKVTI